jgi:ribose transport system substrate-binding protein
MVPRKSTLMFVVLLSAIAALIATSSLLLIRVGAKASAVARPKTGYMYKWHVMMIGKRIDSPFWQEVYAGAKLTGEAKGAIVELIGPSSDADVKSPDEYIDFAIATRVNGILAYVSDSHETEAALSRARASGIPVITLENDALGSTRQAFVGVSSYELGKMLGALVLKSAGRTGDAMIVLENGAVKSSETIMLSGIHEATVSRPGLRIQTFSSDWSAVSGGDDALRQRILNDRRLSVIVSLNVEDTMRIVQTVIELNRSGSIQIVAFRESPEILDYVKKGIVSAVVAINARQMGERSVNAMLEYLETGHSNDYVITDMHVITGESLKASD